MLNLWSTLYEICFKITFVCQCQCVCVLSHVFKSNCMLKQNPNPTIVNMCLLYIYIVYILYIYIHNCIHMYTPYISISVNIWIFIAWNIVTDTGSPILWRCFSIHVLPENSRLGLIQDPQEHRSPTIQVEAKRRVLSLFQSHGWWDIGMTV